MAEPITRQPDEDYDSYVKRYVGIIVDRTDPERYISPTAVVLTPVKRKFDGTVQP